MGSVWKNDLKAPTFDALDGNIKTDVLIIGGGIAGILCAYMLKKVGVDCVIAEANRVCSGVSENTTAKITCEHGLIYSKIMKKYGADFARLYYKAQKAAINEYLRLCKNIDCDFKERDFYVYSLNDKKKIEDEISALGTVGVDASFEKRLELPFDVVGALKLSNQAEFSPLKFLFALARDLKIFENTRVIEVTARGAITDKGEIIADKIIVATHFPFINKYGAYFLKMYQHRSYVIAYENAQDICGMYVDENESGMSFRSYKDMLLIGGGGHRTGKDGGNYTEIRNFARKYYPNAREVTKFATQDCITLDGIPYIGKYSKRTPTLYVATGFNKWGMTSSMVSAMILCDAVRGKDSAFAHIFSPLRSMLHPTLIQNAFQSVLGLITPSTPRCPHLGCALKYNKYEHSWDCPCHGSRFDADGKLLDNPANGDKKM